MSRLTRRDAALTLVGIGITFPILFLYDPPMMLQIMSATWQGIGRFPQLLVPVLFIFFVLLYLSLIAFGVLRAPDPPANKKQTAPPGDGFCPKCNYDLKGSRARCPECGAYRNPPHPLSSTNANRRRQ